MDYEAGTYNLLELERLLLDQSAEARKLPLSLLRAITNDFSEDRKIGQGGVCTVYKGMLRNRTVVVKRLHQTVDTDEFDFNKEVASLMMMAKHKNIVRLLGYCADTQGRMMKYNGTLVMADVRQRLLCFEYLTRGSLDAYITDASRGLDWRKRYRIIKGVCEGLNHLHQNRILHLDLKPATIYLDNKMVPKICDFGWSICFHEDQDEAFVEDIYVTPGYMAPELIGRKLITFKTDIFSFGVVITEILTGRKEYSSLQKILESWSVRLGTSVEDTQLAQVRVCAEIGLSCMEPNPADRPNIRRILERLVEMESMDEFAEPDETESMDEFTGPEEACEQP